MPADHNEHHLDPRLEAVLKKEISRQRDKLEMIASENFVSPQVLRIAASVFTNKYAEGYPEMRYYGGCEYADELEQLTRHRARKLFSAEHANVQPHCGSTANMAAYLALAKPGDTILGMSLSHGGHLTHGASPSFSGRFYNGVSYGVREDTELIDYDQVMALADEHRPRIIVAGASSYPRIVDFEKFRLAADRAGAYLVVDMAHFAGLVAAGLYPSPLPHSDIVTSTTHKTLRGPRGGLILSKQLHAKAVDEAVFPGVQGGPLMHIIAAKAQALAEALEPDFIDYQRQILKNTARLATHLMDAGYRLVSGGTDTHLVLVDLRPKGISGQAAETALGKAGITANKNVVPFDKTRHQVTSGLRLGTAALTTRGLVESDIDQVADFVVSALRSVSDDQALARIFDMVRAFLARFPLYPGIDF
ncbi:MAG: serine hydroxymethyltransferase [Deltaproteobacteria bacterium]|jgi:glycine hydroxymethyltransferase|nr:serine hydroxymethyltransferase [Deltaproteobacteria bacterium]